jgi:IclR family mhp operon transcriptional activator
MTGHGPAAQQPCDTAIQSLAKGLRVLDLLSRETSLGFLQIKRASGLPNATLARILQTLEQEGWVSRRLVDGQYRLTSRASGADALNLARGRLAEIASESLERMHRSILWPSDISICDGSRMLFLESNRGAGPLMIDRRIMDKFPSMLWSAAGRTYLAFCPTAERRKILANLARTGLPDDEKAANVAWVRKMLTQTRRQGYGQREPSYPSPDQKFLGQLGAIAVPIRARGRTLACLSLVWVLSMASKEQIVQSYLRLLQETADTIGEACAGQAFTSPLWLDGRYASEQDGAGPRAAKRGDSAVSSLNDTDIKIS